MKSVLLALLSLKCMCAIAQYEKVFTPSAFQDTIPFETYNLLKNRLIQDKAKVTAKGKAGTYIKSLYDHRFDYIVKSFNEGYLMIDHPLTSFLEEISNRIYRANPQLSPDVTFYTFASTAPNAVSFGEGTACFMLGLLERLETEDQVAYVLCHELAHYYADHSSKNFQDLASINYDKELKRKIDAVLNSPYNQYAKLKALFGSLNLSISKHSRGSEYEADSLGLVYYLKSGYDPHAPLRVMQILEQADRGLYQDTIDFRKFFNFAEFPLKESWLSYTKSGIMYMRPKDGDSDTLKTHPNCKSRFEKLKHLVSIDQLDTTLLTSGKPIKAINDLASFEILNASYYFKQYGKALFSALLLAERFPDNPYPHAMISKSLYQLYKAQKNHELHKVLDLPDPRFDENYDRYLTFVNKLRLHELANIAYAYITTRPEAFYSNEEFIHALWLCSRFEFSKVDAEKISMEYQDLYPNGKYIREMLKQ